MGVCSQLGTSERVNPKNLRDYPCPKRMVHCFQNCSDPTMRKNCSSDREKLLKFEAEDREFAKFLRSLEQFI